MKLEKNSGFTDDKRPDNLTTLLSNLNVKKKITI